MSKRDDLHWPARRALEKEGWTITQDPLVIVFRGVRLKADLGAERRFVAEKEGRKIAVEVKDFDGPAATSELEKAMGQLQLYGWALEENDPTRELWLAVSETAYRLHFTRPLFRTVMERNHISLIIFDAHQEIVKQWLKQ